MNLGICPVMFAPLRAEPSDKKEMVSQILFGEHFTILEKQTSWFRVQCNFDRYEGWVDEKQILVLTDEESSKINDHTTCYTTDILSYIKTRDLTPDIPVAIGSSLPGMDKNKQFSLGNRLFELKGSHNTYSSRKYGNKKEEILSFSRLFLNAPYLWGGRTPFGIDCSGFNQVVFKLVGIPLPRDASLQATQGENISFISDAEPGDLLFFDDDEENIIHTGIYLGDNQVIHASGQVRIDSIDHQGIFNKELGRYTHHLRLIRRIIMSQL